MSLSIPISSFLDLHSLLFPLPDLLLITFLLSTLIIPYLFYTLLFHPLAGVPGPWLSAITPIHHHVFTFLKGQEHETDIQLHQRYGPFVRIAPNTVMCEDPEVLRTVYAARGVVKGEYYSEVDWKGKGQGHGSVKSVFHEREPEGHRAARRRVAHPVSVNRE